MMPQQHQAYHAAYSTNTIGGGSNDSKHLHVPSGGGGSHRPSSSMATGGRTGSVYSEFNVGTRAATAVASSTSTGGRRTNAQLQPTLASTPPQCQLDSNRRKLEKVLEDKDKFFRSARASFEQFDKDRSGTLDFHEIKLLISRLCYNLQLPPVDDVTLTAIFEKYDSNSQNCLTLDDFAHMYWRLLLKVRDKYYPPKRLPWKREDFVTRCNLARDGKQITDLLKFQHRLGAGAFGEVHLVQDKSSQAVRVCKTIKKDMAQLPREQMEEEIRVLKSLDHPNIIKIFEVLEDDKYIYLLMEQCTGGELIEGLTSHTEPCKVYTEANVGRIMKQVLSAVNYFHKMRIVHKDLKPPNILWHTREANANLKIIDFGLAEMFERPSDYSANAAGSLLYMAPEVFKRRVNLKSDIWSAGCIMFQILTGFTPFHNTKANEVRRAIELAEPDWEGRASHLSPECILLLKGMLKKEPRERFSAADTLNHIWFRKLAASELSMMGPPPALTESITLNLRKYMKQTSVKNTLINMLAHQTDVSTSQIKRIQELFKALDKDQDGILSSQELRSGLEKAGLQPWDINRIVQALDVDNSGTVGYNEFLAACYTWQQAEFDAMFKKLDVNNDGYISSEEVARYLGGSKMCKEKEIGMIMKELDANGDGLVDYFELQNYFLGEGGKRDIGGPSVSTIYAFQSSMPVH